MTARTDCSEIASGLTQTVAGPVAAVVLTYNSADDLPHCLAGLAAQRGVDLRVIVVDNASRPDARAVMAEKFSEVFPEGAVLSTGESPPPEALNLFLCNEKNSGYSAGNNIGARAATALGCVAVLIINPDMRITDSNYVAGLYKLVAANPKTAVACSALTNLSGIQENPMTEPGFSEELLFPVRMLTFGLFRRRASMAPFSKKPFWVSKVSGACFLIRMDFLHQINFFDESVFLYCEESILHAQVRSAGWRMIMDPRLSALHAHNTNAKGNQVARFRLWAESRRRFHIVYGRYGKFRQGVLGVSRNLTLTLIQSRAVLKELWNKSKDEGGSS